MHSHNFFRLSWLLQLFVGIALFTVSLLLQGQVLIGFLAVPPLAWALAFSLEAGKALAIVWHRYLRGSRHAYPISTRWVSAIFRIGLLALSLICSLLFIGEHLDRPRLAQTRQLDLQQLEAEATQALARFEQDRSASLATLRQRNADRISALRTAAERRIDRLESDLQREMNNVVKGQFKGPRYRELSRRLEDEKSVLTKMLQHNAAESTRQEERLLADLDARKTTLLDQFKTEREQLYARRYLHDERAADPRVVALVNLAEALVGAAPSPQAFIFTFALLLGVLLELGIVLAFDTVTVSMMPAIRAQHDGEIDRKIFGARTRAEAEKEASAHKRFLDRIQRRARDTVAVAERMAADRQGS